MSGVIYRRPSLSIQLGGCRSQDAPILHCRGGGTWALPEWLAGVMQVMGAPTAGWGPGTGQELWGLHACPPGRATLCGNHGTLGVLRALTSCTTLMPAPGQYFWSRAAPSLAQLTSLPTRASDPPKTCCLGPIFAIRSSWQLAGFSPPRPLSTLHIPEAARPDTLCYLQPVRLSRGLLKGPS